MDTVLRFELPTGHELFVNHEYTRGAIRAAFGYHRCVIKENAETIEPGEYFGGLVTGKEALGWIEKGVR